MHVSLRVCGWLSAALLISGCGPDTYGIQYRPVSGRITLDGEPLAGATVVFAPSAEGLRSGRPSIGETNAAGEYQLTSISGVDGAVVGEHAVSISTAKVDQNTQEELAKESLPAKYNLKSELSFTVPDEGTTAANFDLLGKK